MLEVWTSARRICSGFRLHSSLSCFFRPVYFSSMFNLRPYRTGVVPSSLMTVDATPQQHRWLSFPAKAQEIVLQEAVSRDSVPVISRCMELSMGSGRDRKLKGSKRALMCPHVLHFTWDLSWPWKRSTTMERFLRRWFSHACGGGHTNTRRRRRLQQDPCGRRRWAAAAQAAR